MCISAIQHSLLVHNFWRKNIHTRSILWEKVGSDRSQIVLFPGTFVSPTKKKISFSICPPAYKGVRKAWYTRSMVYKERGFFETSPVPNFFRNLD